MSRTKKIVLLVLLVLAVAGPIAWGLLTREEQPILRVAVTKLEGAYDYTESKSTALSETAYYYKTTICPIAYLFDLYRDGTLRMYKGGRGVECFPITDDYFKIILESSEIQLTKEEYDKILSCAEAINSEPERRTEWYLTWYLSDEMWPKDYERTAYMIYNGLDSAWNMSGSAYYEECTELGLLFHKCYPGKWDDFDPEGSIKIYESPQYIDLYHPELGKEWQQECFLIDYEGSITRLHADSIIKKL